MRTNTHRHAQRGVTLVELLLVVAIVAILGSIATANYRSYSIRANRAEAKTALLNVQTSQEKYYLNQHTYTDDLADLKLTSPTERGLYTLQIRLNGTDAYTATATAAGSQVADSECPSLSIDETGKRLPDMAVSKCWR